MKLSEKLAQTKGIVDNCIMNLKTCNYKGSRNIYMFLSFMSLISKEIHIMINASQDEEDDVLDHELQKILSNFENEISLLEYPNCLGENLEKISEIPSLFLLFATEFWQIFQK